MNILEAAASCSLADGLDRLLLIPCPKEEPIPALPTIEEFHSRAPEMTDDRTLFYLPRTKGN
jgi:hypothetical protein